MYDHLKNAGNIFDVFKHGVLMKAVENNYPSVYFESHCGFASYSKPELWESSWIKVHRLTNCHCILCDTNPDVEMSVIKASEKENWAFMFQCTDGFKLANDMARRDDPPNLFFIDPPYKDNSDWNNVIELIKTFLERDLNWIVWYPIFKNGIDLNIAPAVEMYWTTPENLHGCGMAFGGFNKTDMEEIHNCLGLLQWCLSALRVEKINERT